MQIFIAFFYIIFVQQSIADMQEGLDAYGKQDYTAALHEFKPLAEKGDATAQNYLGLIFLKMARRQTQTEEQGLMGGNDISEGDKIKAKKWFGMAAQQGNVDAQMNLGEIYQEEDNSPEAIQWYLKAAGQNNIKAKTDLGHIYLLSAIDPQNPKPEFFKQSFKWTLEAAKQGDSSAQDDLAQMYHEGWGIPKDYETAMYWYRKAASQGDSSSFYSMAEMYESGEGVVKSRVIAYALQHLGNFYEQKSSDYNDETHPLTISEESESLVRKMSEQEVAAAKRLIIQMENSGNALNALDQYIAHPSVVEIPLYVSAGGKVSLCSNDEMVLLSCVTKTRMISLCSSKNISAENGYMQYRVEKDGKLEFEFPNTRRSPFGLFEFKIFNGAFGGGESLTFKNGQYFYTIEHSWDKYNLNSFDINVIRNSKSVSTVSCLGELAGKWPSRRFENTGLMELMRK